MARSAPSSVLAPFVAMPFAPSSFLFLVVMLGAPSSVLAPFVAMPFAPSSFLFLVAMPGAPSSVPFGFCRNVTVLAGHYTHCQEKR